MNRGFYISGFVVLFVLAACDVGGVEGDRSEEAVQGDVSENGDSIELLNVSYDPTREFYDDYNQAFADYWYEETGDTVSINQSHGGQVAKRVLCWMVYRPT